MVLTQEEISKMKTLLRQMETEAVRARAAAAYFYALRASRASDASSDLPENPYPCKE